ncbi:MAG: MtrB/PioB family outer membrane beta-barrel protein, partial [Acidobacteriota bacterium]|nr:MtrB/PioB family outer membrane beta-barrel protein [Acidobacteriota bacterium]
MQELPPERPRLERPVGALPREVAINRALAILFGSALAAAALAQSAEPASHFTLGRIDFGVQLADPDTNSSKFEEYRDVPNGVVIPFLRIYGEGKVRYNLVAQNVLQDDGRYRLFIETDPVELKLDYNRIPHRFGNDARMLHEVTGPGVLELSDTLQQAHQTAIENQFAANRNGVNFAFLSNLVAPSVLAANRFDLELLRERGTAQLRITAIPDVDVRLNYFQEKRTGNRAAGTSFGFGNVVETPEPIDYRTEEVGATAEYAQSWGLVRGAVRYNTFSNPINTLTFDNPFRVTDSTDPSAYTAPASGSIGGAARGRVDLSADNEALTGAVGFQVRLPANSRFTADVSLSRWTQDDTFMPYTTNTAITTPVRATDLSVLPERSLDGEINVVSQSYVLTSRPLPRLGVTLRYRIYDLNNDTRRIEFPGYVRFDAVWEEIPRISVPYSYKRAQGDATVSYDVGPVTLEGGYRYVGFDRTFRETEQTQEDILTAALSVRAFGWAMLRAGFETGERDREEYDYIHSEEASYLEPEAPVQLPALRRFDQAKRDVDRFTGLLQVTPGGGDVTFSFSYLYSNEDYGAEEVVDTSGLRYGLLETTYGSFTAEADYSPSDRFSIYGFFTREKNENFQRGRQSGATPSTDPRADWTSDVRDEVDSFGGGANVALVPEKWELRAFGRYQKVDGRNALASPPGGTPDIAFPIAVFDDTRLWTVSTEVEYRFSSLWSLALGGWLEDYEARDSATTGLRYYVPGS